LFCPPSWWPKLSGPSLFALGGEFAGTGGIGGVGGAGVYVDQNGDIGIYTSHGFAAGGPGVSLAAAATESQSRASFFGQSAGVTVSGGEAVVGSVSVTGNPAGLTSSVAVGVGGGEPVNVQVVGPNTQPLVEFNSPVVAVAVKGLMILNGATFR